MHPLRIHDHRDLHQDDLRHPDVELHQLMDLNCDMDLMHLQHLLLLLHLDVAQNLDVLDRRHLPDVVRLDVLQNLDVVHLVVARLDVLHPLVVVVGAELRHQLRMDYCQDVADVEQRLRQRMDYFQDVVQLVHRELELKVLALQVHLVLLYMQQLQQMLPALLHVMPSTLQDQHRALLQVLPQVLD
jgi:hypothetical protein